MVVAAAIVASSIFAADASAQQQGSTRYSRRFDPNVPRYQQPEAYTRGGYTNLDRRNRDYYRYGDTPAGDTFPRRYTPIYPTYPTYTYPSLYPRPIYTSPYYGGTYYPYGASYVPYQAYGFGPR